MNLNNLSKRFYKALDVINKLPKHERLTLCTLLTTVDHNNPSVIEHTKPYVIYLGD